MNCNTTHYRANSSSVPGDPTRIIPGGLLDIQGNPGWFFDQGGAQSAFEVQGALTRSVGTGTVFVPGLSVSGTLVVTSGVLEARNAGTSSGTLTVGAGAELRFAAGTHTFTAPSLVNGAGLVHVSAGTTIAGGGWGVTGTTRVSGGTLDYDAPSGTTAVLEVVGGVKGGSGVLGVTGSMTWSGGNLASGGGITRVENGGTLDIQAPTARTLNDHTLEIGGTGVWSGATSVSSGSGGTIRVLPTGSFDIQGDVQWFFDQGGAQSMFEVQGNLTRSFSSGTAIVPGLAVSGTLTVSSGVLEARNVSTSSGSYVVNTPGEFRFGVGNQTFTPASSVSGTGIVNFLGGGHTIEGSWNVTGITRLSGASFDYNGASGTTETFQLLTGVKGGSGLFIVNNSMTWSGGNISGDNGTTRVAAPATLTISGATGRVLNSHTLEVLGTGAWNSAFTLSSGSGARLRVGAGGVLTFNAAPTFAFDQGGSPTLLENQGTLLVNGPGATIVTAQFEDAGVASIAAGATLDLRGSGTLGGTATTIASGGVLRYGNGTFAMQPSLAIAGPGLALLDGATLSGLAAGDTVDIDFLRVQAGNLSPGAGGVVRVGTLFDWGGTSTLGGGGTTYIPPSAVATFTGTPDRTLTNHTIDVDGALVWTDPSNVQSGSSAVIRIRPAAGLTVQPAAATTAAYLYSNGGGTSILDLQGALILSTDANFSVSANLQLTGSIALLDGTMNLTGGGTLANLVSVDAAAALNFNASTYTLADQLVVSGLGLTTLNNATLTNAALADTADIGRLRLALGTLDPTGVLKVSDHLDWAGSTQITGGTVLVTDTLEITGAADRTMSASTLELEGVTRFLANVVLHSGSSARIRNMPTGTFEWGDGDFLFDNGGGQSRLENFGTLQFTGAGVKQVSAFLVDTTGLGFSVLGGTLDLSGGARVGNLLQVSGAVLQVSANTFSMQEGTQVGYGGPLRLTNGTVTVDTLLSTGAAIGDLELLGGQVLHEGLIEVANSMLWTGGEIESNTIGTGGRTRILNGAPLTVSGAAGKNLIGLHILEIDNAATADFGGSGNLNSGSGAIIENTGDFTISGTGSILYNQGGAAPRFRNLSGATLRRNGATPGVVMNFPIENAGGVLEAIGDTLRLTGGAVTAFTGTGVATSAPIKLLGTFAMTGPFAVSGANGTLVLAAGTLTVGPSSLSTTGDFVVTGSGLLNTSSAASDVEVDGNAVFNSSSASIMTAGVMRLRGHLTQGPGGSSASYAPSGTHVTSFDGTGRQQVSFSSPGVGASRFAAVDFGGNATPRRVEFLTNAFATLVSDTTMVSQDSLITAANALLTTGAANLTATVFAGTRLAITTPNGSSVLDAVRFDLMDVTATQLSVDLNAAVAESFTNMVFATTPTTGYYVHARQMTNGANATLALPAPVSPTSPGLFYNTTANGGVTPGRVAITWSGTPLTPNP